MFLIVLLLNLSFSAPTKKSPYCSVTFAQNEIYLDPSWVSLGKPVTAQQQALLVSKGIDPTNARFLGGQAEGLVFLLNNKEVVKIFHREFEFKNAMLTARLTVRHLKNSGFLVPQVYRWLEAERLVFMQFVPGKQLDDIFYTKGPEALPLAKQYQVFRDLRTMFASLERRLKRDPQFTKVQVDTNPNSVASYHGMYEQIPGLQAALYTKKERAYMNLHSQNVMTVISDTGTIYYVIVDIR